jgi:predicted HNH restriction endonuclease
MYSSAEQRLYQRSAHWQQMRAAVLARDDYRCRACDVAEDLHVHHRYYPDDPYAVRVEDLTTLCANCHAAVHRGFRERARWSWRMFRCPVSLFPLFRFTPPWRWNPVRPWYVRCMFR